jgi:PKD repeat protein
MNPTQADINLLRSRPHNTKLWLSVYQPNTVLACQVNDLSISKGEREITYDGVTEGSYLTVQPDMMMYVSESTRWRGFKGKVRVRSITSTVITVAENSHIDWNDDDFLTIVSFYEIIAKYPRILQDPADETNTLWYKDYDIEYSNQNSTLGAFVCMGTHYAGFVEDDVYYTASGTFHLTGEAMTYHWFFEGGDTTGSSVHTPGNIGYSTPGHYTTRLTVSGTSTADVSYRHISIYDRPEDGATNPILGWELVSLGGTRDQGGYAGRIRIHDDIDEDTLTESSLIVIFADDRYGSTDKSIGGNALNRSSIAYVGYVVNGSIRYNYRDSSVEFDVASPTEFMKFAEGFSVSVEDSADPAGQASSDPNYPSGWVLLLNMDVRRALYHYLFWHSTTLKCVDFEFLGTDKLIQYFDADRSSIYDAVNTLMSGTLIGRIVSDRQGKIWAETDIYTESGSYDDGVSIQKRDWMDDPFIEERNIPDVSFIEAGGIYYTGATGTYTPLLSVAPGEAPAYRGKVQRIQGLALTGQAQLNTLTGNIFAFRNAKYPNIEFRLAGNYRNYDIAPQEKVPLTIAPADTARGINITSDDFFVNGLQYTYNSEKESFLPVISLHELTAGVDADTSIIPVVPPVEGDDGGFSIPPIVIPPIEIPPFPDIEIPSVGLVFIQPQYSYDVTGGAETTWSTVQDAWTWDASSKHIAHAQTIVPAGTSSITISGVFTCLASISGNVAVGNRVRVGACDGNLTSIGDLDGVDAIEALTAGGVIRCIRQLIFTENFNDGDIVRLEFWRDATHPSDNVGILYFLGWSVLFT